MCCIQALPFLEPMCEHDLTCSTLANVIYTPMEYEAFMFSSRSVLNLSYILHKLQDESGGKEEAHSVTDTIM